MASVRRAANLTTDPPAARAACLPVLEPKIQRWAADVTALEDDVAAMRDDADPTVSYVSPLMSDGEKHMDSNDVLFFEPHAAAQSLKSVWTRLASTYGCMMVAVSRETLRIKPHWFARWLITPLCLDLSHDIPVTNIRGVTEMGEWYGRGKVELHFMTMRGEDRKLLLYLKKYREFMDAARNAIRPESVA
jgi:hypothetical protein